VRSSIDQLARRRELPGRQGLGRPLACLIVAFAAALVLAACGSSTTTTTITTTAAESGGSVTSPGTAQSAPTATAPTATKVPGCRSVPAPESRAGEEVSKPTGQLDPAHSYTVRLATNCGPIVIQLAVKEAPKTTASFVDLVEAGYYNRLTFHRVVPGFVIQGGDPKGDGTGGPSWEIVEPPPANLRYTKGVVAMAKGSNAPSGASSSQFFIVVGANTNLPPEYALVGHVVSGERNVEAISRVPTDAATSKPLVPIVIERATLSIH
jgi:peptidyl-prolyl cis-trans isomerase B (cyclophilin B)